MRRTFYNTLAYLLEQRLLEKKHLTFFTDGARNIRKNIEEVFGFRSYSVILDWYHLKKRGAEYLSMSVTGEKKKRNEIEKFQQPCGESECAHRQKHHGMSWSVFGSGAIAQIKVHFFNDSAIAA